MIRIMQLVDSLDAGGTERVAVNLANALALQGFDSYLCVTRKAGLLKKDIAKDVKCLYLNKRSGFDVFALVRLIRAVRRNKIEVIHAHSSSVFWGWFVSFFFPKVKLVWHVHYGALHLSKRSILIYRILKNRIDGILAVNHTLADWTVNALGAASRRVWFLPNFVTINQFDPREDLPGEKGYRVVCVANLRPDKDHLNLIHAISLVVKEEPETHLILIGANVDSKWTEKIQNEIDRLALENHVSWLGVRNDVGNILANCDIGVLSSSSEGLPLALLEYGAAGLAVVVTDVGECSAVIENGRYGTIVPANSPKSLSRGILNYIEMPEERLEIGRLFSQQIENHYSPESVMDQLVQIYSEIIQPDNSFLK